MGFDISVFPFILRVTLYKSNLWGVSDQNILQFLLYFVEIHLWCLYPHPYFSLEIE